MNNWRTAGFFLYIFLADYSVLATPLLLSPILYFWEMSVDPCPESCRSKLVRYQLSLPFLTAESATTATSFCAPCMSYCMCVRALKLEEASLPDLEALSAGL
jgi:hypothetical protein